MALQLVTSFFTTRRALTLLVFVAVCLSFQGFSVVLSGKHIFEEDDTASSSGQDNLKFEEEKQKSLEYVKQFRSTKRSLKFFHIPKAAGTAIEHVAGEQLGMPWGSCLFHHRPKRSICKYPKDSIKWPRNYGWWHVPAQLFPVARSNPYDGAELFAIIRDPFDRLVSEFYYICQLPIFDWRPDQCDRSRLFDPAYMNEWLQNKLSHKNFSKAETYLQDNGHFTPQYDFLVNKQGVRMVDYVLHMDDLQEQFTGLMDAFSLDIKMADQKMNAARTSGTHLETTDLNVETVNLVQNYFQNDFGLNSKFKRTPWPESSPKTI